MNEITLWGSLSQEMTAIITDPIYLWDLIGTFVFGISGVLLGLERRMDVFGMFILASFQAQVCRTLELLVITL